MRIRKGGGRAGEREGYEEKREKGERGERDRGERERGRERLREMYFHSVSTPVFSVCLVVWMSS